MMRSNEMKLVVLSKFHKLYARNFFDRNYHCSSQAKEISLVLKRKTYLFSKVHVKDLSELCGAICTNVLRSTLIIAD